MTIFSKIISHNMVRASFLGLASAAVIVVGMGASLTSFSGDAFAQSSRQMLRDAERRSRECVSRADMPDDMLPMGCNVDRYLPDEYFVSGDRFFIAPDFRDNGTRNTGSSGRTGSGRLGTPSALPGHDRGRNHNGDQLSGTTGRDIGSGGSGGGIRCFVVGNKRVCNFAY